MSNAKDLLVTSLEELEKSVKWLTRSYQICQKIDVKNDITEEEFDSIEAFSSRYARTIDLLINKVLRLIDKLEFIDQGTMIDIVNRSHKRGIIESTQQIRELKDLRNRITHEYSAEDQLNFFIATLEATQALLPITENTKKYCQKNILAKL